MPQDIPPASEHRDQKTVFISHIGLEQRMAMVLKKEIESAFDGKVTAFVSSARGPVDNWLANLQQVLTQSSVFLVMASEASVGSTWVFFEIGFAKAKGIPILPICYPGMPPERLPPVLSTFGALQLAIPNFGYELMRNLRRRLELPTSRAYRYADLTDGIQEAWKDLALKIKLLSAIAARPRVENTDKKLAAVVAEFTEAEDPTELTKEALGELTAGGYISAGGMGFLPFFAYSLTERGREVLARLIPPEDAVSTIQAPETTREAA